MEYLVRIDIRLPIEMDDEVRSDLYVAEAERAKSLASEGLLVRMWRIPGRRANWGLWRTPDATTLHEALSSLPLWKYSSVEVTALARHPGDPASDAEDTDRTKK